ncbi:sensor histidine kinase [Nonomuraea sp. NPDC050783]|uniref:sensor histidine kinase n=1 Tax=Nonomuraea sp. NPDC050783 TaxID=3154634 RepID=UPI003466AECD
MNDTVGIGPAEAGAAAAGLAEELRACLDRWSARTGIRAETWALPAGEVPPRVARAVLTALREALENVERHSGAATVSVAVTAGDGGLRMTVSDDGRGLPSGSRSGSGSDGFAGGRGTAAMRAAFAETGGTLTVHGVPDQGTTVTGVVRWSGPRRRSGRRSGRRFGRRSGRS